MAVPSKIANVKLFWHIEPINPAGTYTFANMKLVFDKPLINGVECKVNMLGASYDAIRASGKPYTTYDGKSSWPEHYC